MTTLGSTSRYGMVWYIGGRSSRSSRSSMVQDLWCYYAQYVYVHCCGTVNEHTEWYCKAWHVGGGGTSCVTFHTICGRDIL